MTRHWRHRAGRRRLVLTGTSACCLVLLAGICFSADWPGWRGPLRDGRVPANDKVPAQLPVDRQPVWRVKIGAGFASPVVAGHMVFYLDAQENQEILHALERGTGQELWRAAIDDAFKDFQSPAGPRCTPLVDGDRVYALSCKGELRCLAVADGKLLWRTNFTRDFHAVAPVEGGLMQGAHRHGHTGSPWIEGPRLIAFVGDTNGAGVVCFDKLNGAVLWKSQNDRAGNAPPIVAQIPGDPIRQVIAFTVEGLIGLDLSSGELLWRVPLFSTYGRHVTTPVLVGNVILVASHERGMVGVEVTRDVASVKWNARIKWDAKEFTMNFASPVAVGDYLYGLGPDKNIFCVEASTGRLRWSKQGYTPNVAENSHAALLVVGRNLLLLSDTGELVLFPADPAGFTELGRVQVCGLNWCNPAYADGKLFIRDARELLCLDLLP